jgi:hypothetical protein
MRSPFRALRVLLAVVLVLQACTPSTASADPIVAKLKRLVGEAEYSGTRPPMGADCSMEALAENIDWLEHHIDTYGSIVAKQPDIWGQARLTKHRDEYERMMFRELNQFKTTINAAISQSDSSFLAQALALSSAAGGTTLTPADGQTSAVPTVNAKLIKTEAPFVDVDGEPIGFSRFGVKETPGEPGITLEPTLHLDQMSRYLQHLHELRRINEGDDTSDSPGYSLNLVRIPVSILPGKLTREGFGAEITITATPVLSDDLLPTTFHNLAVNDAVDLLGLPLVRITESLDLVAEAERVSAAKSLFETLMVRIDEAFSLYGGSQDAAAFSTAITESLDRVLTNPDSQEALSEAIAAVELRLEELAGVKGADVTATAGHSLALEQLVSNALRDAHIDQGDIMSLQKNRVFAETVYRAVPDELGEPRIVAEVRQVEHTPLELVNLLSKAVKDGESRDTSRYWFFLLVSDVDGRSSSFIPSLVEKATKAQLRALDDARQLSSSAAASAMTPTGRTRRALNPLNPTYITPIVGVHNLAIVSKSFAPSYYGRNIRWNGGNEGCSEQRVDLLDARKFLQAELEAAFELLAEPSHLMLLAELASPSSQLASQIRSGHFEDNCPQSPSVAAYRHYFFERLHAHQGCIDQVAFSTDHAEDIARPIGEPMSLLELIYNADQTIEARSCIEALAWVLVVESALLNERLNQDVRKLGKARQAYQLDTQNEYLFFLPDSVLREGYGLEGLQSEFQLATSVFQEYVRVRWPIHVFAVDPREQDQNVADVSQRQRELQFALALGFATGKIGANSLTQYSRQMETQIETISLNRTIVGFGHGSDTFGWRFTPRVQALDVPGTLGSIRETLCGTSRDYDLKHRQLEPGQRECVAIVLMPSFVPYADFDVRSNWFKLTNPKNAALTMKDSLQLSRAVTAMRHSRAQCAQCQHLYRDGELSRLFKRVDQLDRELPLQTQRALVPYENTLGGFEMFNTGITDLAPELIGFYGAPGINLSSGYKCGCYQACGTVRAECKEAEACENLNSALTKVNATLTETNTLMAASAKQQPFPICEGEGTSLFLVGDNFSVHDTKVIAGGVCIPHVQLISRELMRVTIPSCVNTVKLCEGSDKPREYVAIYVATPYGVTNHMHVPVVGALDSTTVQAEVEKTIKAMNIAPRTAAITAANKDNKVVKVTAVTLITPGQDPKVRLQLRENANSGDQVQYQAANDPSLWGKKVNISASVMFNGKFITPLESIGTATFSEHLSFPALGANGGRGASTPLLRALEKRLQLGDFPADRLKPLQLKIVYYASAGDQGLPQRLIEEVDLEIGLQGSEKTATSATGEVASGNTSDTEAFADGQYLSLPSPQHDNTTEPEHIMVPVGVPAVQPQETPDCGCGNDEISSAPSTFFRRTVQLAQYEVPLIAEEQDLPLQSSRLFERLDRIEATLAQIRTQSDARWGNYAGETSPASSPQSRSIETSSMAIEVANPIDGPMSTHKKWLGAGDYPLMNQMKIGFGEQWRNLRDKLPCY